MGQSESKLRHDSLGNRRYLLHDIAIVRCQSTTTLVVKAQKALLVYGSVISAKNQARARRFLIFDAIWPRGAEFAISDPRLGKKTTPAAENPRPMQLGVAGAAYRRPRTSTRREARLPRVTLTRAARSRCSAFR